MEIRISFSADNLHFHGVVYLLMINWSFAKERKTEIEEARNVVPMILLEINFQIAVRLVAILDVPAEKNQGYNLDPRVLPLFRFTR